MASFESDQRPLERNLIFVGLALERGWIDLHQITHAFTVWICDKTQSLANILVNIGSITEPQKRELDQGVEQKLFEESSSAQAVNSLESLEHLTSHLDFLRDDDLDQFLSKAVGERRLHLSGLAHARKEGAGQSNSSKEECFDSPGGDSQGRFQWKETLSEPGGMGDLSITLDKELNRLVVVKKIKPSRAADPLLRGLFQLEGEVTGHLEHPNIPPVYSMNKDSKGHDFFAMRYFKGRKLTEAIREYHVVSWSKGGKSREKLVELLQSFQTACLAVEFAHQRGVLHCDLKPDNIMVGPYGETLVIDWGLVFVTSAINQSTGDVVRDHDGDDDSGHYSPSKSALTGLHQRQGGLRHSVGGTLPYMAPEQLQASRTKEIEKITCATDVFLLGATLYHLLTNRPPYLPRTKNRETASDLYDRIGRADSPSPRSIDPGIDQALESIVKKAMHLDPSKRYASPRQLANDIRLWLSDEPTIAHPDGVRRAIGRWLKRNLKTAISTATLAIFSLLVGSYFVYQENLKAKENLRAWYEMARGRSELILQNEAIFSKSSHGSQLKKRYLQDVIDKYNKLLKYDDNNSDLLLDYLSISLMLSHILRTEHNLSQSMRHWHEANRTFSVLKTKQITPSVLEKTEVILKRELMLTEWKNGRLSVALKGQGFQGVTACVF